MARRLGALAVCLLLGKGPARAQVDPGGDAAIGPHGQQGLQDDWNAPDSTWSGSSTAGAGLYARLLVGPAYLALVERRGPGRRQVAAASLGGALAVGATVSPGAAVFVEGVFASSFDPQIRTDGGWQRREGVSITTVGLGIGGTYRLEHDPATASLAVGMAQMRAVERAAGALLGRTAWGPTAHLTFGRSWPLGSRSSAGLAIRASIGRYPDGSGDPRAAGWLGYGLGLLLSATRH